MLGRAVTTASARTPKQWHTFSTQDVPLLLRGVRSSGTPSQLPFCPFSRQGFASFSGIGRDTDFLHTHPPPQGVQKVHPRMLDLLAVLGLLSPQKRAEVELSCHHARHFGPSAFMSTTPRSFLIPR